MAHATITILGSREEVERRWREFDRDGRTTAYRDAPGDRGLEVHVTVDASTPLGALGTAVKKLRGDEPQQVVRDDLRRLKQLVEVGEITRSDGAPGGTDAAEQPLQHAAQPREHAGA